MNHVKQVYLKEVREMLRDKRTRSMAFFGPIFMMILFVCGFGSILGSVSKTQNQTIHVLKTENPLTQLLEKAFKVVYVENEKAGEELIRKGDAKVFLAFGAQTTGGQLDIDAYFDPKAQGAQIVLSQVSGIIETANKKALEQTLTSSGLPATAAEPVKLVKKEVQIGEKGAGEFIVSMLPYLIVIWAFYGGFSMATDLVAGEKEKATLETLLISPVTRTQIVLGKFFALASLCLASSVSSLIGFMLVSLLKLPGTSFLLKGGLGITPTAAIVTILVLLPTVAMFAACLLSFSTYAKNAREAQSYISLASFVVVVPAAFSQLIGLTDAANQGWVNFVPVLNTANNIRNALLGKPDWIGTAITVTISGLIAALLLVVVVRLFNREEVLTRV